MRNGTLSVQENVIVTYRYLCAGIQREGEKSKGWKREEERRNIQKKNTDGFKVMSKRLEQALG